MEHPDDEVLAGVALGETPEDPLALSHVSTCEPCAARVNEYRAVLGTAAAGPVPLVTPPDTVWERIAAGVREDSATTPADSRPQSGNVLTLPVAPGRPGGRRWPLVAAAAVAGIVVGGVGMRAFDSTQAGTPTIVTTAALDTLDTKTELGRADVVQSGSDLKLRVHTQPLSATGGYLEVWLINKDLKRMVSIGVLRDGATDQSFAVSQTLLDDGYRIVDISKEQFDDKPAHSGESLVRGALA